jgi:hypothetical protein
LQERGGSPRHYVGRKNTSPRQRGAITRANAHATRHYLRLAQNDIPLAQDALSPLSSASCTVNGDGLTVNCPRSSKMEVLSIVSRLGSKLIDLNIQEASLEDVFFGFSN